jgi:hypothetical protein
MLVDKCNKNLEPQRETSDLFSAASPDAPGEQFFVNTSTTTTVIVVDKCNMLFETENAGQYPCCRDTEDVSVSQMP